MAEPLACFYSAPLAWNYIEVERRERAANKRRGRNADTDFRGENRSNDTPASTSDPDPRLYRKGGGQASRLC